MSPKEKREKLVTIKVKESTYRELIKTKGAYEALIGQRFSMDDIVMHIINEIPRVDIIFQRTKETEKRVES